MLDKEKNKVFIAGKNKLEEESWDRPIERLKHTLKNYLELDNVSFLFGAGSSIILGSVSIANIPAQIEERIKSCQSECPDEEGNIYEEFLSMITDLQMHKFEGVADESEDGTEQSEGKTEEGKELPKRSDGELIYPLEQFLNYLSAIKYIQEENPEAISYKYVNELLQLIKSELFALCDLENKDPQPSKGFEDVIRENKYHFHEMFVKKVLQRPLTLRRANIFTTNYDVAFEHAFDKLGVQYIDGFSGFNKRTFKPETFDYDIFFPGSTTQGKVHRIERVLKYFKLHGSLTWFSEEPSPSNIYGIREYPIDHVRTLVKDDLKSAGQLMIYPTTEKKSHTLDFPYSELLRQFSSTISQPQSILVTFGYSFRDEHINDIIYQALAIPSFTLIVVDYNGIDGSDEIMKLMELKDPRIIILQGKQLGDLPFFVQYVLPDIIESKEEEKLAETLQMIYNGNSGTNDDNIDNRGNSGYNGEEESTNGLNGQPDLNGDEPVSTDGNDLPDLDDIDDDLPL